MIFFLSLYATINYKDKKMIGRKLNDRVLEMQNDSKY